MSLKLFNGRMKEKGRERKGEAEWGMIRKDTQGNGKEEKEGKGKRKLKDKKEAGEIRNRRRGR